MSIQSQYHIRNDVVIRVPLKSIETSFTKESLVSLFKLQEVREAIYLSSPEFYTKCIHYLENGVSTLEDERKLMISLAKYAARLHIRCTPFGLFAGCAIVNFGKKNLLRLKPSLTIRSTRLDSSLASNLFEKIASMENIDKYCHYIPNTSLYTSGNSIRYVETYYQQRERKYRLASVDNSDYLRKILNKACVEESTLDDLAKEIVDKNITIRDAKSFVNELKEAAIIVSEIELSLSGNNFLIQLSDILKRIEDKSPNDEVKKSLNLLSNIRICLENLDEKVGNDTNSYEKIRFLLEEFEIDAESKYIFQVDMFPYFSSESQLNQNVKNDLYSGLQALMILTPSDAETELERFIKRFKNRYGDAEVSLLNAIDGEIGVGYGHSRNHNMGLTPLINDLKIPRTNSNHKIRWGTVNKFLFHKLQVAREKGEYSVQLNIEELEELKSTKYELPDTTAVIFKLINGHKSRSKTFLQGTLGSSAVNLLGRFGTGNKEIANLIMQVTSKEQNNHPNKIIAEVIHLPSDSRAGNVLLRPDIRSFDIPYLSKSNKNLKNQIKPSDLRISIRNNRVYLRSAYLNKEILPRLTNAHNYSSESLPVYHFLCDLQLQGKQGGLYFDWGDIKEEFVFLPRVNLGSVILSEAKWQFKRKQFECLLEAENLIFSSFSNFRKKWKLPHLVLLQQGNNELLVNLENELSIQMFLKIIKNRNTIVLKEFLFNEEKSIIRDEKDNGYSNEFIALLEKRIHEREKIIDKEDYDNILKTNELSIAEDSSVKLIRNFGLGSQWIYYKIYCGTITADKILVYALKPLIDYFKLKKMINQWFFIRYADPDPHLRIRIHLSDTTQVGKIITLMGETLLEYEKADLIWQVQTETYEREIERYGTHTIGLAEKYFYYDSESIISMLSNLNTNKEEVRWKFAIRMVNRILDDFQLTIREKLTFMDGIKIGYADEFKVDKFLKIQIDKKYRRHRKEIDAAIFSSDFEGRINLSLLIDIKTQNTKFLVKKIIKKNLLDNDLELMSLIASFIHMTLNRIFNTKQRIHELVIYDFMWRTYRSEIAKLKQQDRI